MLAADAANLGTRARIADVNVGLGHTHAALADGRGLSREARAGHWRAAKAGFLAGQLFWKEMRDTGKTTGSERDAPERLAQEIAKCDAALGRLR